MHYTESGQQESPDKVSEGQQSIPDGQEKFLDEQGTALKRGETIQSDEISMLENQKMVSKKEIRAAVKEQKKEIKDVLA